MMLLAAAATIVAGVLMPPAEYDHEPDRPYVLSYVAPAEVERICGVSLDVLVARLTRPNAQVLGCTAPGSEPVQVVIDATLPPDQLEATRRHELAHVNGWRH